MVLSFVEIINWRRGMMDCRGRKVPRESPEDMDGLNRDVPMVSHYHSNGEDLLVRDEDHGNSL